MDLKYVIFSALFFSSTFFPCSVGDSISVTDLIVNIVETQSKDQVLTSITSSETSCSLDTTPNNAPFILSGDDVVFKVGGSYSKLNYSKTSTYSLTITCNSNTVDIEVDVHPNVPPVITDYPSVSVEKNAKEVGQGDTIYTVVATDTDDRDSDLTYTLYSDDSQDFFQIDETSGEITAVQDLRYSTVDLFPLKVNVSDGTNVAGPLNIYVRLTDLNERPQIENLPVNITITEDSEANTLITTLTVSDDDNAVSEDDVACSVKPNSESYKFKYDRGKLRLDSVPDGDVLLDYESTNFYNISCIVNDGYLNSESSYINLYVKNVNEPPEFNQDLYTCDLYESEAGVSTCDLPMVITDVEDQSFTTSLLSGNNSQRFSIDTDNKRLTFQTNYDVDDNAMPDTVVVTVAAVDEQGQTGTSKIEINVRDVNDNAPDFGTTGSQTYTIGSDTQLGVIGSVSADDIDSDKNGEVTYSLTGGSSSALAYVNVLNNGEIQYSNTYDYSLAGETHYLEVTAKDKGSPQLSSTTTVEVYFDTTTTTTTTQATAVDQSVVNNQVSSSSSSFLDDSTNVGLLAALLSLLGLAALAGGLLCCCRGNCFGSGESNGFCECCKAKKVEEVKYRTEYVRPKRVIRKAVTPPPPPPPEPKMEIVEEVEEIEEPKQQYIVEEVVEEDPRMLMSAGGYSGYYSQPGSYYNPGYQTGYRY